MQLRPRQEQFVQSSLDALLEKGNTLGIAATGFGKTIAMSALAGRFLTEGHGSSVLILQHREELLDQNSRKFAKVNPDIRYSYYNAQQKSMKGNVVFGMVQTLSREQNLADVKDFDLIITDECHRIAANSYINIIDAIRRKNAGVRNFGVTATPDRSDRKTLRSIFDNIADEVTIEELVRSGHLVMPRTFIIDLGVNQQLSHVQMQGADYNMHQAEEIMNKTVHNDKAVQEWAKLAQGRKTMEFCSTVKHAQDKADAYIRAGFKAKAVWGDMPKDERRQILSSFATDDTQVIVNVAIATEGYDCPPISCVILSRPCSDRSVIAQMIGRGLRTVDPEEFPGVEKSDCYIIDFGNSLKKHGASIFKGDFNLEEEAKEPNPNAARKKTCPGCEAEVPAAMSACPFCGWLFLSEPEPEEDELENFTLKEINIFTSSPYQWESFWNDSVYIACAFNAWVVCLKSGGVWHSMGASESMGLHHIMASSKTLALAAADDFLRENGDSKNAKKTKQWLQKPASAKQCHLLGIEPLNAQHITRYKASCMLQWKFNERGIRQVLNDYQHFKVGAAA